MNLLAHHISHTHLLTACLCASWKRPGGHLGMNATCLGRRETQPPDKERNTDTHAQTETERQFDIVIIQIGNVTINTDCES